MCNFFNDDAELDVVKRGVSGRGEGGVEIIVLDAVIVGGVGAVVGKWTGSSGDAGSKGSS